MFNNILVVLLLAVMAHGSQSLSETTLEVIVSNTKLPSPRSHITTGYDGDDNIYLWGGGDYSVSFFQDILKYSISKQTIENIGTMPIDHLHGSGCWIGNNNFVHMGGFSGVGYHSDVWNFDTTNPSNWTLVTNLSNGLGWSSSIWDEVENTYTIGGSTRSGYVNTILKYSSITQTVVNVGVLPEAMEISASLWDNSAGSVYIFGGQSLSGSSKDILKFNTVAGTVTTLSATLPVALSSASAIWNGKEAYIIGGTTDNNVPPPPIVRFNPTTNEVTSVPVNNFPNSLYSFGCVFVEKLNRIYIFGGYAEAKGRYRDEIMYIDLNDSGSPGTTTETRTTDAQTTTITTTTQNPGLPDEVIDHGSTLPVGWRTNCEYRLNHEDYSPSLCPMEVPGESDSRIGFWSSCGRYCAITYSSSDAGHKPPPTSIVINSFVSGHAALDIWVRVEHGVLRHVGTLKNTTWSNATFALNQFSLDANSEILFEPYSTRYPNHVDLIDTITIRWQ